MRRYLRLLTVGLLLLLTRGFGIGQTTDEIARCIAFLRQNVTGAAGANVGSGFLVQVDDTAFLVTAAHVARAVGQDWTLVLQGADGKPATVRVQDAAWKFSTSHDVAVLLLNVVEDQKSFVLGRSLPVKDTEQSRSTAFSGRYAYGYGLPPWGWCRRVRFSAIAGDQSCEWLCHVASG